MAIKSIDYTEFCAMENNSPTRKYRTLKDGTIVLESEAEELCCGERSNISIAYRLLRKPEGPGQRASIAEVKSPKKLERIALSCIRGW